MKRRGYSLIEIIISISLLAIITLSILTFFNIIYKSYIEEISKTIEISKVDQAFNFIESEINRALKQNLDKKPDRVTLKNVYVQNNTLFFEKFNKDNFNKTERYKIEANEELLYITGDNYTSKNRILEGVLEFSINYKNNLIILKIKMKQSKEEYEKCILNFVIQEKEEV